MAASPDFNHSHAGFHEAADVLADLSVGLGCLSEVIPQFLVGFIQHALLLAGHTPRCTATGRTQVLGDFVSRASVRGVAVIHQMSDTSEHSRVNVNVSIIRVRTSFATWIQWSFRLITWTAYLLAAATWSTLVFNEMKVWILNRVKFVKVQFLSSKSTTCVSLIFTWHANIIVWYCYGIEVSRCKQHKQQRHKLNYL